MSTRVSLAGCRPDQEAGASQHQRRLAPWASPSSHGLGDGGLESRGGDLSAVTGQIGSQDAWTTVLPWLHFLLLAGALQAHERALALLAWFIGAAPIHSFIFFFKDFISLFMRDTERERGRDTGRGRSRFSTRSPMQDSISGPQDHALSQRQMLNH